jgi:UDP-N-acetylmuramyl pentapeptide phosphotransferase/UDP-N-acetylglucosamine-1-phosphate transferase
VDNQFISMLLLAFAVGLATSAIVCGIALALFPWFRSGERKAGHFRHDESSGSFRVDTVKRGRKGAKLRVGSNELPLVGGPAMMVAVAVASIAAGVWIGLDGNGWILLGILLLAMLGFGIVGFVDDARKVYKGSGISEIQKFAGVFVVALGAAVAFNRLVYQGVNGSLSARLPYPPYTDLPFLGPMLQHVHFAWIVFFLLMTVVVTSSTALAVDFSDGMDGLCGGLLLSAALSFAAILLSANSAALWPAILTMLALAGATLGFLPFNWPSSWRGRGVSKAKRRAKLIMGDSGSLALGGLLALVAVISRSEFLLIFIGGVFLLEGLSALISARILVRFFRIALFHERFRAKRGFPHTELPLPFLATPMHHHYDLLGWDKKRLVYSAWLLGAGLGVLSVASVIGTITWERYLARFVAFLILLAVWQSAAISRGFFIGLTPTGTAKKDEPAQPRTLVLYYGYPFKLFGRKLYGVRDVTGVTEVALTTPAEQLALWQRMNVFDARALLGFYCYRAGALRDAVRIWDFIPRSNLLVRREINEMLQEARNRLAMESEVDLSQPAAEFAPDTAPHLPSPDTPPADAWNGAWDGAWDAPLSVSPTGSLTGTLPPAPGEITTNGRRLAGPSRPLAQPARLEPVPSSEIQPEPLPQAETLLWSAAGWVSATTPLDPEAETERMPAIDAGDLPPVAASNGHRPTPRLAPSAAYADDADALQFDTSVDASSDEATEAMPAVDPAEDEDDGER